MPRDNVKKICPAAASHTFGFKMPLKSGSHKNENALLAVIDGSVGESSVTTLTKSTAPITNIAGSAILQNFSIPPDMPFHIRYMLNIRLTAKNTYATLGGFR